MQNQMSGDKSAPLSKQALEQTQLRTFEPSQVPSPIALIGEPLPTMPRYQNQNGYP